MKKMILAALAACMCVCLCFGIFAACDDRSGNGEQPAEYTITANNGTGYTVDAPASAKDGDTVTVTVTVTNEDTYVTGVTYNEDECDETDGKYTFTLEMDGEVFYGACCKGTKNGKTVMTLSAVSDRNRTLWAGKCPRGLVLQLYGRQAPYAYAGFQRYSR